MGMDNHSFVIRVWLEEAHSNASPEKWRGHITHYPTLQEKYFDDFGVIRVFIDRCLAPDGSEPSSTSYLAP